MRCLPLLSTTFLLIGLFFSTPVYADKIAGLYQATVPVATQSREEQGRAIREAFVQVLIRVSGRTDLNKETEDPTLQSAIATAKRYVSQYRYTRIKTDNSPNPTLAVWVKFDEQAVNKLLQTQNLPVWGRTRPATLVWLVVDNRGTRQLISNNAKHIARTQLMKHAELRGVPLRWPLLDLTDRANIHTSDVWGNFEDAILSASERYHVSAVLVGRVNQSTSGLWYVRWTLYQEGRRVDWSHNSTQLSEVLGTGIDKTAETLALRYARVRSQESDTLIIKVSDIRGLADYNRVVKYLRSLTQVTDVQPFQIANDSAIFHVKSSGGRLAIAQSVSLGHTLITVPLNQTTLPMPNQDPLGGTEVKQEIIPDLVYRLVP